MQITEPDLFIISYPTNLYDFKGVMERIFECSDLTKLHEKSDKDYPIFNEFTDQSTIFHTTFYNRMNEEFIPLYNNFIKEGIKKIVFQDSPIVYQRIPTFRCHLPGNLAVGSWHKDKDFGHSENEMNFWMPFTPARETNTIWIESEEDKGDYRPVDVNYGEIFMFDGANLKHGNKTNETGVTRVSVDFRIIPKELWKSEGKTSITNMTKFDIGEYWDEC